MCCAPSTHVSARTRRRDFQETVMMKRIVTLAALCVMASIGTARAQSPHVEVSGYAGWTFTDGVSGTTVHAPDGNTYDRVDPKDSASFGLSVGVLAGPNAEIGFMY